MLSNSNEPARMPLTLTRSLVFFDLETTGTNPYKDRIVEICMIRVSPGGAEPFARTLRMNPGIPIPADAAAVHGITDADVRDLPGFGHYCRGILDFFRASDIAGFNVSRFDLPMLSEEFKRCGVTFPEREVRVVDPYTIFIQKEQRTLAAAVRFYCGKDHHGAHGAEADARATLEILAAQIERYPDIGCTVNSLHDFCVSGGGFLDAVGRKLKRNQQGEVVYTFGKNNGRPVKEDPDYARWILASDFPSDTKEIIASILREMAGGAS